MQILLSCAKTMTTQSKVKAPFVSEPLHKEDAAIIALHMSQRSVDELEELLKVNAKIALENQQRYQVFHSPDTPELPALLAYTGIVFKRIDPQSFDEEDFKLAQAWLRLTSFAYGLLRPLDVIRNYRLEGTVRLEELGAVTLFDYWKDRLTSEFIADIKASGGTLCNLASHEMKQLFHWKEVEKQVRIVTPEFKVWKEGKLKTVVVYAKMCRGEMTRYIIKNSVEDPEELKNFSWDGFNFDPSLSEGDNWVFVSTQK